MIMSTLADEPILRDARLEWLLQTKRHQRLGRNIYVFALGQDLSTGSACCANPPANRRALAATCNSADDRTEQCAAAHESTRALIGSETVRRLRTDNTVLRLNTITLP